MKPEENTEKKTWKEPELHIISQNNLRGGAATHYYEKSIKGSVPVTTVPGYQYKVYFNGGGSGFAHHKKSFYAS